jgi:hypothetical protein
MIKVAPRGNTSFNPLGDISSARKINCIERVALKALKAIQQFFAAIERLIENFRFPVQKVSFEAPKEMGWNDPNLKY